MNKKELNQAFENIKTSESNKNDVFNNIVATKQISAKSDKRSSYGWVSRIATTAAIIAIFVIPVSIYADEIKDFFNGFLKKDDRVAEYVKEDIFEDSDGHIKMTLREVLSDQLVCRAIVSYEALDEVGIKWLEKFNFNVYLPNIQNSTDEGNRFLAILPDKSTSFFYNSNEIEEYRTELYRCYELYFWASEPTDLSSGILYYPMTNNIEGCTTFNITNSVEAKYYKLVGDTLINDYVEAKYIRLSMLSYNVYGKANDLIPQKIYDLLEPAKLKFKNGEIMTCYTGSGYDSLDENEINELGLDDVNMMIYSAPYDEELINTDEVESIILYGHELKLEEL